MCLIAFAHQCHPVYPLILVANRDEFHDRPTRPADFWGDHPELLAGKDLTAGGSWLGVTRTGKLAAVTNYREGVAPSAARSRGDLVLNYLSGPSGAVPFATNTVSRGELYNGFNLLLGEGDELYYCSNRQAGVQQLDPGIYSLSNHLLNSPWPKSEYAKQQLGSLLSQPEIDLDLLIECLHRRAPFPQHQLPETGVSAELERTLSPPFIAGLEFGTRCTTAIARGRNGETRFIEQSYTTGGKTEGKRQYQFQRDN